MRQMKSVCKFCNTKRVPDFKMMLKIFMFQLCLQNYDLKSKLFHTNSNQIRLSIKLKLL